MSFDGDERVTYYKSTHTHVVFVYYLSLNLQQSNVKVSQLKNTKKKNIIEFSSADRTERCTHPLYSAHTLCNRHRMYITLNYT